MRMTNHTRRLGAAFVLFQSRNRVPLWLGLVLTVLANAPAIHAQSPETQLPRVNYLLDARQPPGSVAAAQRFRVPSPHGSFQAVSVTGPAGTHVALAQSGTFLEPLEAPVTVAMRVGDLYRIRVTQIPFRPGEELYPTIEVIDRLYSPPGREHRFPIPVVLTEEDLRNALDGALVTRVIYLEDSENASPLAYGSETQHTVDVGPRVNALQAADQLGRPVAILRIGSRVPANLHGDLTSFLFGCPPWLPMPIAPDRQALVEQQLWPEGAAAAHASVPYPETTEPAPRVELQYGGRSN